MATLKKAYYSTTQLYTHNSRNLKTTLAKDPCTGRALTASVLRAKNKKRLTNWARPHHRGRKDERRIGWKKVEGDANL